MQHSKILYNRGLIKQKNMVTQSQLNQVQFRAQLDNIKSFYNSLKAINFNDDANIIISENGLQAIVEESKYVQASIYVTRDSFSEFRLINDEEISIRINLSVVTDCLSVFASPESSMKMLYKGHGAPLVIVLEQHDNDDLITEVSVKTKNAENHVEYAVNEEDQKCNSLMIRGPDFYNLLGEINKSVDVLEVLISPRSPYFRLKTIGAIQSESNVQIAKTSDMFLSFESRTAFSTKYKMSHIRLTMKALSLADKVAMRNDGTGLLSFQIMVLTEGDSEIYIEYFITPVVDDML